MRFKHKDALWLETMSMPEPNSGCWLWLGSRDSCGYGRAKNRGRCDGAHRISFELTRGPIPDGMCVLHSCDNPACVNPEHLSIGTQADNAVDRKIRGRHGSLSRPGCMPRGDKHWSKRMPGKVARGAALKHARLNESMVREIRSRQESDRYFAELWGVGTEAIRLARNGTTWRHVT